MIQFLSVLLLSIGHFLLSKCWSIPVWSSGFLVSGIVVFTFAKFGHLPYWWSYVVGFILSVLMDMTDSSFWLPQICLLSIGFICSIIFPVPQFQPLQGVHQTLGVRVLNLDGVECRIFYPGELTEGKTHQQLSYLHFGKHLAKGLAVFLRIPAWLLSVLHYVLDRGVLHAYVDCDMLTPPDAEKGWPVVFFSHGLAGTLELYAAYVEQLTSNGMIVVVLNHNDGSASVTVKDNQIEYYTSLDEQARTNWTEYGYYVRHKQLNRRVQDVYDVYDAIKLISMQEEESFLYKKMDFDSVAMSGHSFGAATALTTCVEDHQNRFHILILLDGWMQPLSQKVMEKQLDIPVLHLISEQFLKWKTNFEPMQKFSNLCIHEKSKFLLMKGLHHNDFCDLPLFAPILTKLLTVSGTIRPSVSIDNISSLSSAYLLNKFHSLSNSFDHIIHQRESVEIK